ncbi:MAG TPA: Stp1/IreP family PP2C-type Ser/Thr phosphatase [Blastocatellia bacterium]|jgi:protein phosphatase
MFKRWKKSKQETSAPTASFDQTEPPAYKIVASVFSDPGCVRETNEDSGRHFEPDDAELLATKGSLFIVADGMGGHSAGEVASRMAVDLISRFYYENSDEPQEALRNAFLEANREIHRTSLADENLAGMGTTCTALVVMNHAAIAAHIGDSRLYLVREGQIYLMTEDHSAVMEMVKRGWLSLEEARHHPDKNVILRAMGSHPEVEVSIWDAPFPVRVGDRFMLCSDGLYDLVEDEEIRQIVTASDPSGACETLIAMAKERGGHDNITVAIVSLAPKNEPTIRQAPTTRIVEVLK